MSDFHIYTVQRDHNRHHCIVVAVERKYTYFVPMEAAEVTVRHLPHEEFKQLYEVVPGYPVRRAAEIFLAAPDKEVSPKAREHLERILADPAYVYDSSLFSVPHVIKEQEMARQAAAAAEKVAKRGKKSASAEVHAAADAMSRATPITVKSRPVKALPKTEAAAAHAHRRASDPAPRGRTPALPGETRLKVGKTDSVKRGFMLEFVEKAKELEKASRGKGFTIESIVDGLTTAEHEASWVRTYVTYALDGKRGILVQA